MTRVRCDWAGTDPLYVAYHDEEWGVPVHDDRTLFEFLVLEGAQAGLSWITILRKRDAYRRAFADFDPAKVARFDAPQDRAAAAGPRDRAQPAQGRVGGDERARVPGACRRSSAASTRTSGASSTAVRVAEPLGHPAPSCRRARSCRTRSAAT